MAPQRSNCRTKRAAGSALKQVPPLCPAAKRRRELSWFSWPAPSQTEELPFMLLLVAWGSYWHHVRLRGRDGSGWRQIGGQAIRTVQVVGNPLVKPFGNLFAVIGLLEPLFVAGIAEEGDFREHRRHVGSDQHHERRLAHSAVAFGLPVDVLGQRVLNVHGQIARLLNL